MDFSKINELKPYDLNCNIFDVYSYDGLSMQELLCQFFTKINECVEVSNDTLELTSWLVNEGLKQEVVEKLLLWYQDGTLEELINVTLFENLNKKLDELEPIKNSKVIVSNKDNLNDIINSIDKNNTVYLSNLTHKTQPFEIKENISIEKGELVFDGSNTLDYNTTIYIKNKNNIKFNDIKFILEEYKSLNKVVRGIVFYNCNNINLTNLSFYDFTEQSIRLENCTNIVVDKCYFNNSNNLSINTSNADDDYGAIAIFNSTNIKILNSTFENCGTGISVYSSSNILISNNNIEGNINNVSAMGIYVLGNCKHIKIDGNIISNFKNEGIVCTNIGDATRVISYVTITNNTVKDCLYCLLSLDVNVQDSVISNNKFIVDMYTPSNSVLQISNSNNIVLNSSIIKSSLSCIRGIYLSGGSDCIIENNFIEGLFNTCIDVNQHKNHFIKSNSIKVNENSKGISIYPINSNRYNHITGNIITGDSTTILLERRVTENLRYYIISNNLFKQGKVNLNPTQNCYINNNIFSQITSDSVIIDNGDTVIKNNIGYDDNRYFITDKKPTYNANPTERGRILQVQDTNDYLVYVQNNDGVYKYNRIAVGVGDINNSTAANVETLKDDFNKLLGKLRVSGILS